MLHCISRTDEQESLISHRKDSPLTIATWLIPQIGQKVAIQKKARDKHPLQRNSPSHLSQKNVIPLKVDSTLHTLISRSRPLPKPYSSTKRNKTVSLPGVLVHANLKNMQQLGIVDPQAAIQSGEKVEQELSQFRQDIEVMEKESVDLSDLDVEAKKKGNKLDEELKKKDSPTSQKLELFTHLIELFSKICDIAESNAHKLYDRINGRVQDVDHLIRLTGKINNSKGDIDWSTDSEMKEAIDRARKIGVEIEPGKYSWTENEKSLLKENIQNYQSQLDKATQMERTDMQKHMQDISRCQQFRSSILTMWVDVMKTINRNLRLQ